MMISCTSKQIAYHRCRKSWGGATLYVPNQRFLESGTEGYVFAVGPTIETPEDADYAEFRGACARFEQANPEAMWVGFFHDNAKRTIDINPVWYVRTRAEVDAAYANGVEMPGGAYELHTGDGYWPQGRPEVYS